MAKYIILSGEIQNGNLYKVAGEQSVVYNSVTYVTDQTFRGVAGFATFTYSGFGTQIVNEVTEFKGGVIEFVQNPADAGEDTQITELKGMSLEFELNEAEKIVQETTVINGMSLELIDYPLYSYMITEERFSMKPD